MANDRERDSGSTDSTTVRLERSLNKVREGDQAAKAECLEVIRQRLVVLASRMYFRSPNLRQRFQAEDLLQESLIRLWRAMEGTVPASIADFMGFAAIQMRRALIDLIRSDAGRYVSRPVTRAQGEPVDSCDTTCGSPDELAVWSEFHIAVEQLPDPYRTVFDLLYYHELSQAEVAGIMNVSVRQVQRYWREARLKVRTTLDGSFPRF